VWVKLVSIKGSGSTWAVDQLISAHGQHSVKIPNIAAGTYLLRAEIVGKFETKYLTSVSNMITSMYF
jgi:cellulase